MFLALATSLLIVLFYLRLPVPLVYDCTTSGLCGNFNGDRYDDMEMKNGHLAKSCVELLHTWAEISLGQHCTDSGGRVCLECSLCPLDSTACAVLLISSIEVDHCWNSSVESDIYARMCIREVCAGEGHMAVCLALEAYSAGGQAKGTPVGPWKENTSCALHCPDCSSPVKCVDSSSNFCPALLQTGSSATGCQCHYGIVDDEDECVPYSQCGCVLYDIYLKMDEQLYIEDFTQRCWFLASSGVICEEASCVLGQQCALRHGSWGCHDKPEVCELKGRLQVSTLGGQEQSSEPLLSYSLMSLGDETSVQWFSAISYHGPCDGSFFRLVAVFQILLHGSSFAIQDDTLEVAPPRILMAMN